MKKLVTVLVMLCCLLAIFDSNVTVSARAETKEDMLNNLRNSSFYFYGQSYAYKKSTMIEVAEKMLDAGFEPAFVAGALGNVAKEGSCGMFENVFSYSKDFVSKYYGTRHNYIAHMNGWTEWCDHGHDHSEYRQYAGKLIYNGFSLSAVSNMLEQYKNEGWLATFGLGCLQWTSSNGSDQTIELINYYKREVGSADTITYSQCVSAEAKMIANKLGSSYAYSYWKSQNATQLNSVDSAYSAGYEICVKYERPANKENQGIMRGNIAREIFSAMAPSLAEPHGSEMTTGYERTILDGDYIIACAGNVRYYLDIQGSDVPAKNESNVTIAEMLDHEPPAYDVWTVTYMNDGFYSIKQYNAEVELDLYGASTAQGANVSVHESANNSAHRWAIKHNGDNGYTIQAKCSGFYLDVEGNTVAPEANVRQYSMRDSNNQVWVFIPYKPAQPIENGRYIIISGMDDGYEIDIPGDTGEIDNCANVQIWNTGASSKYNSFDVTKLDNGYYKFIHTASGKALDLYGGGTDNGRNVSLYDHADDDSYAHQWAIIPYGDKYLIYSRWSGYVLDVNGGEPKDGANIYQWPVHGGANQKWVFVKAEHTVSFNADGGSNAPDNQAKYYGEVLILSTQQPVRNGYSFLGWSKVTENADVLWQPGDEYRIDEDTVLYAQWEKTSPTPPVFGEPDFTLPSALTTISESAFESIAASVIDIPDSCTNIGKWAFRNCPNLRQIRIPANCVIGTDAFIGCNDVVIFGKKDSAAESYANSHSNCTFVEE